MPTPFLFIISKVIVFPGTDFTNICKFSSKDTSSNSSLACSCHSHLAWLFKLLPNAGFRFSEPLQNASPRFLVSYYFAVAAVAVGAYVTLFAVDFTAILIDILWNRWHAYSGFWHFANGEPSLVPGADETDLEKWIESIPGCRCFTRSHVKENSE